MAASNVAQIRYPIPGAEPNVAVDMQNMTTDLDPITIPVFATTAARDLAYTALIAAGKVGMTCWVTNRAGHSVYHGPSFGWRWLAQTNLVFFGQRMDMADTPGTQPVDIITTGGNILLPGTVGSRLIEISAHTNANVYNNSGGARAFIIGTGTPNTGNYFMQSFVAGTIEQYRQTLVGHWYLKVAGGNASWALQGLNEPTGAATGISFRESELTIIDHGPVD